MRRALLALVALAFVGTATAATAAPPKYVDVQRNDDGSICVTFSLQVPQCTPPTNVVTR